MNDNLDWTHHDSKTVNENYYQILSGNKGSGKTLQVINVFEEKYKQLQQENQQLKKQKENVVEYIKYNATSNYFDKDKNMFRREIDLLRMLGEIDE